MTKKEYVLKVLKKIKQKWEFWKILYELILKTENNKLVDDLYTIFSKNINKLNSKILEKIYMQTKDKIEKIKKKEKIARDYENIDSILDNL